MSVLRHLWRGLLTVLLLAALGVTSALLYAPELLAPAQDALTPVLDIIAETKTQQLLVAAAGLVGVMSTLVVLIRKLSGSDDGPVLVPADQRPPESTSVDPATVSGHSVDVGISAVDSLETARDRRQGLRETAVEALQTAGERPGEAERRIKHGAWTDDELAAGFLGESVPVPLLARLRGWLDDESEAKRRLTRSIDAIATLAAAPEEAVRRPVDGGETDE